MVLRTGDGCILVARPFSVGAPAAERDDIGLLLPGRLDDGLGLGFAGQHDVAATTTAAHRRRLGHPLGLQLAGVPLGLVVEQLGLVGQPGVLIALGRGTSVSLGRLPGNGLGRGSRRSLGPNLGRSLVVPIPRGGSSRAVRRRWAVTIGSHGRRASSIRLGIGVEPRLRFLTEARWGTAVEARLLVVIEGPVALGRLVGHLLPLHGERRKLRGGEQRSVHLWLLFPPQLPLGNELPSVGQHPLEAAHLDHPGPASADDVDRCHQGKQLHDDRQVAHQRRRVHQPGIAARGDARLGRPAEGRALLDLGIADGEGPVGIVGSSNVQLDVIGQLTGPVGKPSPLGKRRLGPAQIGGQDRCQVAARLVERTRRQLGHLGSECRVVVDEHGLRHRQAGQVELLVEGVDRAVRGLDHRLALVVGQRRSRLGDDHVLDAHRPQQAPQAGGLAGHRVLERLLERVGALRRRSFEPVANAGEQAGGRRKARSVGQRP